ncbi:hypothetical protein [Hymenobacter sp. CRA2]|uniref:hypothetical protein n=1 Tax=Hymenobacter sp. CRA2 TaxID=1955620 RepID=UPI00098F0118|nr:hypothetical protein [Hymenobacter sp. CRA2]OON69674.1 hypothetical protein B0919_07010 [Hymenobacter sp. CRA2]
MKFSLLLLLLPLQCVAQYRPSYTPAPPRISPTPYQVQQRSQQQAHQTFQRMQAQQSMLFQQQQFRNQQQATVARSQQAVLLRPVPTQQQLERAQALQEESEQKANEKLARLTQELQRKRQEHPAADAQQAEAQQQEDAKLLTQLSVQNYSEVFLPGQVFNALHARRLSPKAHADWHGISQDLLSNSWWNQHDNAQLAGQLAAYGKNLTVLTSHLLEFDIASAPPATAPLSVSRLDEMLAKDAFDQAAANQIILEAAKAEKIAAGDQLAKAVMDFNRLTATAASQEMTKDSNALRDEVKASLKHVNKEMQRYTARIGASDKLYEAQKAVLESTSKYVGKSSKNR